jgi:preprotein translocase subunit SecD
MKGWKVFWILSVCIIGIIFCIPNIWSVGPKWFQEQKINLGLDLQGGTHLVLEADLDGALNDRMESFTDDIRTLFRGNSIGYMKIKVEKRKFDSDEDIHILTLQLKDPNQYDKAFKIITESKLGLSMKKIDDNRVALYYGETALDEFRKNIIDQSVNIIQRRVDQLGTTEPEIQKQGENRVVVQLPGLSDPERVKKLINKTAKLTFREVDNVRVKGMESTTPMGSEVLPGDHESFLSVKKKILMTGDHLIDAQVRFDDKNNAVVQFKLDYPGAKKFESITRDLLNKRLAMVLDGKVISSPNIGVVIPGGQGHISGNFSIENANDLALLMRAGALPASLTILEEKSIGPSLGSDSIKAGQTATLVSILLVFVFMIMAYGLFGVFANVALTFNIILLMAGLGILNATLTLPGIAGIALTVGMAVDSNVLIFERIKEEARAGKRALASIEAGYNRAMITIVDSQVTTVIGAALLFVFGTGPVKGFAVTLILGIAVSMFTAISLTKMITMMWYNAKKPQTIPMV